MKKIITIVLMFLLLGNFVKADQLEWVTKTEAEGAAEELNNVEFAFLFCGCCDNDVAQKVSIISAEVRYTGTDEYYTVFLNYFDEKGKKQSHAVDLAYVWLYFDEQIYTVGQLLGLEHDPCSDGNF